MPYHYLTDSTEKYDTNKIKHLTSVIGPNPIQRQHKEPKKQQIESIFIKSKSKK